MFTSEGPHYSPCTRNTGCGNKLLPKGSNRNHFSKDLAQMELNGRLIHKLCQYGRSNDLLDNLLISFEN